MSHAKANRNELCPCGSGKKYKRCCANKQGAAGTSKLVLAIVAVLIAGAVIMGVASLGEDSSASPAGQVWSAEHGHYHAAQ